MNSRLCALAALPLCAVALSSSSAAQQVGTMFRPAMRLQLPRAVERTPEQMDAFDASTVVIGRTHTLRLPYVLNEHPYPAREDFTLTAPTTDPGSNIISPAAPSLLTKFTGASECDGPGGCWTPPDAAAAIGKAQFVAVSNNAFEVFSRSGSLQKINSLNGLFGYSAEAMFAARVQYDEAWQRWVITADSYPDVNGNQLLGIAVSETYSATGNWWLYFINVEQFGGSGSFYDYPMLGLTQDAVIFTANIFPSSGAATSSLFAIAKERLYNGFGFNIPIWLHLVPTLEPAHQLVTDESAYAWLAAADGNGITMYALANPGNPSNQTLSTHTVNNVPSYSAPPPAPQPVSCAPSGATLDTLDGRFQNAGTQAGDKYYQVHTIGSGSSASVRYYIITGLTTFAPTVSFSNTIKTSSTSNDFNPSIVADTNGKFGITWSYTDTSVNVSVRFADNNGGNPGSGSGITIATSASCYTNVQVNAWGKYSQVSYDPGGGSISSLNTATFWIDNETVPSLNSWSTQIAKIKY